MEGEISALSIGLTSNQYVWKVAKFLRDHRIKVPAPVWPENSGETPELSKPIDSVAPNLERDLFFHHRLGLGAFIATLSFVIFWAYIMPIAGAVVVGGTFVVHSSIKKVQHKTGGLVKSIEVEDGKRVKQGDILVRLDANEAKAQNVALSRQIDETQLKIARLTAERFGGEFRIPDRHFTAQGEFDKIAKVEFDFFRTRLATRTNIPKLAAARIAQLNDEIAGFQAQLDSNKRQLEITKKELAGMQELFDKKIAPIQRLTPLQREVARLQGLDGQIESSIQSNKSRIDEIKLQVAQTFETFRSDVMKELGDDSAKLGQLLEAYLVSKQTLQHTDIVAPTSGIVHEVSVHTVGGVIAPGDTIMTIIPDEDQLEVDVKLASDRIDQVKVGQRARVKLTAFERTVKDIDGTVKFISADLVESKVGSYYDLRVEVDQHPHGLTLSPGMPAEVFIETDKRTMLSYLVKPLTEQMGRAFRER